MSHSRFLLRGSEATGSARVSIQPQISQIDTDLVADRLPSRRNHSHQACDNGPVLITNDHVANNKLSVDANGSVPDRHLEPAAVIAVVVVVNRKVKTAINGDTEC